MNSTDQLLAWCLKVSGAVLGILILAVSSCTMHDSHVALEAMKHGHDPLRVKCALSGGSSSLHFCSILAAQARQEAQP